MRNPFTLGIAPLCLVLLCVPASVSAADASAPRTGKGPSSAGPDRIEVELVQNGKKPSRVSFVIPREGEVQAWVAGGDKPRICTLRTVEVGPRVSIKLHCHGTGAEAESFKVESTTALPKGKKVVLAEVERADGRRIEVSATAR